MENNHQIPSEKNERGNSRSALWALLGAALGFSFPVSACIGLFIALVVGIGALGGGGAQDLSSIPVHVSGPATGPAVAIVEVNGPLLSGRANPFQATNNAHADDITAAIEQAAENPDVKAILLSVNSPGGSVVASDQIYQALKETHKPIVVLMGEIAASGGYYVSMAADHIVANPSTLTGSIGVISTFPNFDEALDKVGVDFTVITSGDAKDFGSPYREMTEEEQAYWQDVTNEIYEGFVEIVAEGRDMDEADVRQLADGRVYTGRKALDLGLIDEVGYQSDAIHQAAQLGIISGEARVIRYESAPTFFSLLGGAANSTEIALHDWITRMLSPRVEFLWMR